VFKIANERTAAVPSGSSHDCSTTLETFFGQRRKPNVLRLSTAAVRSLVLSSLRGIRIELADMVQISRVKKVLLGSGL
jgi:hypothetical protein